MKCSWNVFWTDHLQMMIEMMPLFRKRTRTSKGTRKGVDETHLRPPDQSSVGSYCGVNGGSKFAFLLWDFLQQSSSNWCQALETSYLRRNQVCGKMTVIIHAKSNFTILKFIYSEKTTKFCEISTVDLFYVVAVKSTVEISQNFVAF